MDDKSMTDWTALEENVLGGTVTRRGDVVIVSGSGAWLVDANGRRYLDMSAAQGVAMLGHAHPALAAAIAQQAQTLISCPSFLYNETRARFAKALVDVLPTHLPHAMLLNSGSEAMDGALKLARLVTGRTNFVAANKAFHGRTMGALSVTWEPAYRKPFLPLAETTHVPYNNLERLDAAITDATAAVVLEVVQGEGGVHIGAGDYLSAAQALCRERGALFIVDEIQTGFGRTGKWFAIEHYALQPDIITLAKGLGGGFPMGALAYTAAVREKLYAGAHGSTFGGNPLACAAGLSAIAAYQQEHVIDHAATLGGWILEELRRRLADRTVVREVRGLGMMIAVDLREKVAPYLKRLMMDEGVIALPAGATVLRLLPPLNLTQDEAQIAVAAIDRVLAA